MSKTGFMDYTRTVPAARPPIERVFDWQEFHEPMPENQLREQGARCMDCGVPFCHTGQIINGSASGCPINNLIPEWNDLVYRGRWREALDCLLQTNNFPEFTGRVCPAPCEGSCVLGINDAPVTIKSIEQAIIDRGFAAGWVAPKLPIARTGKTVAIIGSGPAGLACASQLNQAGHLVTIFERADRPGGLLMYGIPNMKLDKSVVQRRLDLMAAEGIQFINGVNVGVDYGADRITDEFDAIVLCVGATKPRDLALEGRSLRGVHFAMEFLHANTKSFLDSSHEDGRYLSAKDKDVIEQRASDNPWPEWPKVFRVDYGHEEAAARFGHDPRAYSIMTKRFISAEDGSVRAVETVEVDLTANNNRTGTPHEISGSRREWPAQMVLLALGFVGPETDGLLSDLGVRIDQRGNVAIDEDEMTSVTKVFAAGDMTRGQSLVVWAIADGRRAARGVDKYLMGETALR